MSTQLAATSVDSLVGEEHLSNEFALYRSREDLEAIVSQMGLLAECDFSGLPNQHLMQVGRAVGAANQLVTDIQGWRPMDQDAKSASDRRTQFYTRIADVKESLLVETLPVIAIARALHPPETAANSMVERVLADHRVKLDSIAAAEELANLSLDKIKQYESDAATTTAIVQGKAANVTVGWQAKKFSALVDSHTKTSNAALRVLGILLIVLVLALWDPREWFPATDASTVLTLVATGSMKAAFVVLLTTLLIYASKLFAAERHNVIVNNHRQKALETFEVFVAEGTDPKIKDAILVQAAAAVFSPQDTGYTKGGMEVHHVTGTVDSLKNISSS